MRQILLMFLCGAFLSSVRVGMAEAPLPPVAVPSGSWLAYDDANLALSRDLDIRYAALFDRFLRWKARADAFNQKYGGRDFDVDSQEARDGAAEHAWLSHEAQDYQIAAVAFRDDVNKLTELQRDPCLLSKRQLDRDRHALEEQRKSIGAGLDQLDEWTKANEEAQKRALADAVKPLLGGLADKLARRLNAARAYEGWLTRYRSRIAQRGVPYEALEEQIHRAASGYVNAIVTATGGLASKEALKANDVWELVRNEVGSIARAFEQSDSAIREVIADPELKKLMNTDHAYLAFTSSFLEMASDSSELAPVFEKVAGAGSVQFAVFIRDYGYDAAQWVLSRDRILQQTRLSEKNLEAVSALKRQIAHTLQRLDTCRTRALAAQ